MLRVSDSRWFPKKLDRAFDINLVHSRRCLSFVKQAQVMTDTEPRKWIISTSIGSHEGTAHLIEKIPSIERVGSTKKAIFRHFQAANDVLFDSV